MTPDEVLAKYQDELNGLLLAAFNESLKANEFSQHGRFMVVQMRRGRDLLRRMIADAAHEEPVKAEPLKVEARKDAPAVLPMRPKEAPKPEPKPQNGSAVHPKPGEVKR